mmetsp:Transcript_114150/g.197901  ORF Transcript_114150/g.197901 Transcript_114150/m.197901 type:complete len:282 (-) Transcript_114150:480-1325(-)
MHVILSVVGNVIIHNKAYTLDVKTTRCHICGHHDADAATLKVVKGMITLLLILIAMNGCTRNATAVKILVECLAHSFGTGKNQRLAHTTSVHQACFMQQIHDCSLFVILVDNPDKLRDILVSLQLVAVADHHFVRIVEDVLSEPPDIPGPSGCEKHRMPATGHSLQNLPDLWLEAHVEHAVCFVEHKLADGVHANLPCFQEVVQAAWASDNDVHALPVLVQLIFLWRTTVHCDCLHANALSKAIGFCFDLLRQLTRWRHHQEAHAIAVRLQAHPVKLRECR